MDNHEDSGLKRLMELDPSKIDGVLIFLTETAKPSVEISLSTMKLIITDFRKSPHLKQAHQAVIDRSEKALEQINLQIDLCQTVLKAIDTVKNEEKGVFDLHMAAERFESATGAIEETIISEVPEVQALSAEALSLYQSGAMDYIREQAYAERALSA